jgi:hypothetical protein
MFKITKTTCESTMKFLLKKNIVSGTYDRALNEFLLWQKLKENQKPKVCEICQTNSGDLINKGSQFFHEICYLYCKFIAIQSLPRCMICKVDDVEEVGETHVLCELYKVSIFDIFLL